jgi:hypothetical protein
VVLLKNKANAIAFRVGFMLIDNGEAPGIRNIAIVSR